MKKFTQDHIEKYFEENNCILIDNYSDARTPMEYICECRNLSYISFDNFKKGKRCKNCGLDKLAEQFKHDYGFVFQYFEQNNCKLISKEYKNHHTPVDYICECGNPSKIRFSDFKRGKRCWKCKTRKLIERDRFTVDFIKEQFAKDNCLLLDSEYFNAHQKLNYICSCGNEAYITYDKFSSGQRCQKCKIEKLSGTNHFNYNPDITDEERLIKRNYPEYRNWARQVKERDHFTCQKCSQVGGKLASHHINNYKDFEEQRLELSNGITLCDKCHKRFHSQFGYIGTSEDELTQYLT